MNKKIALATALAMFFSIHTAAFADNQPAEQGKGKAAAAINSACEADAKATGCSGMVVGKGLLKCMHKYKKENKDYKFSGDCQSAMKNFREDREEAKQNKQNKQ